MMQFKDLLPDGPEKDKVPPEVLNAPVVFGLEAQGKIPLVELMLAAGKSWDDIGRAIGWCGETAREHYGWHLERKQHERR